MKILVLSPHRDDAAFSVALAIDRWLSVGHRVTVLNVFTESDYAPYGKGSQHEEEDRLTYISKTRKQEDEFFLRHLPGLAMTDLGLEDAPIRLNCESANVCDTRRDNNDIAIYAVRKAILTQAEGSRPQALVAPLALGHHVDHSLVRDAVLPFASQLPTAFYEDLPYAARDGFEADLARCCEEVGAHLDNPLLPIVVHSVRDLPAAFKLEVATLYDSQIDHQLAETIANFCQRYDGGERLWANDLWLKCDAINNRGQLPH